MLFAKLQFLVLNAKFYGMTKVICLLIVFNENYENSL